MSEPWCDCSCCRFERSVQRQREARQRMFDRWQWERAARERHAREAENHDRLRRLLKEIADVT